MVASASRIASEVGVSILKKGGNAVDAACAVGFALAVVYPEAGNLGGGGFMMIRLANGKSVAIDYRETAPAAATETMYVDSAGGVKPQESLIGYKASGVPGTVAGFALAQRKYGKLKWKDVVEPARVLAEQGFALSAAFAGNVRRAVNLAKFPESRRIFQNGGNYYRAGDLFKQPDLAGTLSRIEKEGAYDFYRGKTAHLIAEAMKGGGLITLRDLKGYRAVERRPVEGTYRGYRVITMPPPSSGGIAVVEMLNILEHFRLDQSGSDSAATDHLLIEAMRRVFADRAEFLGDPDFVKIPQSGLLSKKYADKLASGVDTQTASLSSQVGHGNPSGFESTETTHFSVVDEAGNAVANTYTLNFGYGSGVTIPDAGFLMNDEMDDFTSKPGVPNGFGLIQGQSNAIGPHRRPLSSMTPTFLVKDGKLFMVIGSPGGPTIITTVLQVIVNVIDHGMNIAKAIAAPRIHHQWFPDLIQAETGAVPDSVYTMLIAMGHAFSSEARRPRVAWGDAEGIVIDPKTGLRMGASDPRSSNAAAVGY
jgi:gamma-glutamyltranspeptidase/glutathione hydrolase